MNREPILIIKLSNLNSYLVGYAFRVHFSKENLIPHTATNPHKGGVITPVRRGYGLPKNGFQYVKERHFYNSS
jgi:hypothetical protein